MLVLVVLVVLVLLLRATTPTGRRRGGAASHPHPVMDDCEHCNESLSFESVSIWAEVKLSQLPKTSEQNHIRLAGVCELLWVITERAITRFAPLMRLLLTELRANLYIEYSTQAVTPKAPKAPLSSDDKFMESTHLLQLSPFSKLYGNIADQMQRMRAVIEQSRNESFVALYRRKALEYAQRFALKTYTRLVMSKWRDVASFSKQARETEKKITFAQGMSERKGAQITELKEQIKKLEESVAAAAAVEEEVPVAAVAGVLVVVLLLVAAVADKPWRARPPLRRLALGGGGRAGARVCSRTSVAVPPRTPRTRRSSRRPRPR